MRTTRQNHYDHYVGWQLPAAGRASLETQVMPFKLSTSRPLVLVPWRSQYSWSSSSQPAMPGS